MQSVSRKNCPAWELRGGMGDGVRQGGGGIPPIFCKNVIVSDLWWRNNEFGNPRFEWSAFIWFHHCMIMAYCET